MAHVAKYKAVQVPAMVRHWERKNRNYGNKNIDKTRSHLNYEFVSGTYSHMEDLISKLPRKPRKDAVVVADWVVTQPWGLKKEDEARFFEFVFCWLCERYGVENVVSAVVHMDETTPHLHFAWMPITKDGRLCAKDVLNRDELKSFHDDLSKAVKRELGYSVDILLSEDKALEKALSNVPQEMLNSVRQELTEARETVVTLLELTSTLQVEKEALESERDALKEEVTGLKKELASLLDFARSLVLEVCQVLQVFDKPLHLLRHSFEKLEKLGNSLACTALDYGDWFAFEHERDRAFEAVQDQVSERSDNLKRKVSELDL